MMAQKHLHELLKEDQEPFLLKNYIADRRSQIKTTTLTTSSSSSLQPNKSKPMLHTSTCNRSLCHHACFFSFHHSPDLSKSPLFDFPSPVTMRSPCKNPNSLLLQIPARTAALLLDAAMRIQKQSSKPKTQVKNVGFGLFRSILKRFNRPGRKCEIAGKREKMKEHVVVGADEKRSTQLGLSSCNNSRRISTVWSESNEDKSIDFETSSSTRSEDLEEIEFPAVETQNGGYAFCEKHFCSSPFRFALQKSPSPGRLTPLFLSPATSPIRHRKQEKISEEAGSIIEKIHPAEEEEEKEQCSPVSVLDPPFADSDDGGNEDDYDDECTYAAVQRAKLQLILQKLGRFEKLAELDPIELEKRMLEEEEEEEGDDLEEEESCLVPWREKSIQSVLNLISKDVPVPAAATDTMMSRLVLDLMAEEEREADIEEEVAAVVERVSARLNSWKEVVQSNTTIDMMLEIDFRREAAGWIRRSRQDKEQLLGEAIMEIELQIFELLVQELSQDLVSSS